MAPKSSQYANKKTGAALKGKAPISNFKDAVLQTKQPNSAAKRAPSGPLTLPAEHTKPATLIPRKPQHALPKLAPQALYDEPDAHGVSQWRANNLPSLTYELPKNFDPRAPNKEIIVSRAGRVFPMFDYVAAKTGTHIVPVVQMKAYGKTVAHIWGTTEAAREAVNWIDWWICGSFPSKRRQKTFPTLPTLTPDEVWNIEREAKQEAYRQRFRQAVPDGMVFAYAMHVKLPHTSWSLKDILGSNFEALDTIRMECLCYVTYIPHSPEPQIQDTFQVLGNNETRVRRACQRLYGIVYQQDARQLGRPQWWMVKQCKSTAMRQLVRLEHYQGPLPISSNQNVASPDHHSGIVSTAVGPTMAGDFLPIKDLNERTSSSEKKSTGTVRIGSTGVNENNLQNTEATVMTTLRILAYYRGHLRMRASLGQCIFTRYPALKGKGKLDYSLDDFETLLHERNSEDSSLEGHVTRG